MRKVMTMVVSACLAAATSAEVWYIPGWNRTQEVDGLAYDRCTNVFAKPSASSSAKGRGLDNRDVMPDALTGTSPWIMTWGSFEIYTTRRINVYT